MQRAHVKGQREGHTPKGSGKRTKQWEAQRQWEGQRAVGRVKAKGRGKGMLTSAVASSKVERHLSVSL